jgi:hypothetical protein
VAIKFFRHKHSSLVKAVKSYHCASTYKGVKSAPIVFGFALALCASAVVPSGDKDVSHATGACDVKARTLTSEDKSSETALATLSLEKQLHGDLEAMSHSAMLATGGARDQNCFAPHAWR